MMKSAIPILLLASCASVTPQVGYRQVGGHEAGSGHQTGAGVSASTDLGPVELEATVMRWADHGSDDMFVNRSTNDIDVEALQLSLGVSMPIVERDSWAVVAGAGAALQRFTTEVDLSYAGSCEDRADEWSAYAQAQLRHDCGLQLGIRYDDCLTGQDLMMTSPGGGFSFLLGYSFGR